MFPIGCRILHIVCKEIVDAGECQRFLCRIAAFQSLHSIDKQIDVRRKAVAQLLQQGQMVRLAHSPGANLKSGFMQPVQLVDEAPDRGHLGMKTSPQMNFTHFYP